MSRQELAETVNAWLQHHTQRAGALDAHYVARLERGAVRWPGREYRAGFRAILGVRRDIDLGFMPPSRARAVLNTPSRAESGAAGAPNWAGALEQAAGALDRAGVLDQDENDRLTTVAGFPRRTDAAALNALAQVLGSVRRLEDETSAADVLPSMLAQRALIERLVADSHSGLRHTAVGLSSRSSSTSAGSTFPAACGTSRGGTSTAPWR